MPVRPACPEGDGCQPYMDRLQGRKGHALLALVGLPGSGKSTVGRQLARRLDLPYVDADHAMEQRLGCSIREFFEREGEARFRDIESEVLDDLTQIGRAHV